MALACTSLISSPKHTFVTVGFSVLKRFRSPHTHTHLPPVVLSRLHREQDRFPFSSRGERDTLGKPRDPQSTEHVNEMTAATLKEGNRNPQGGPLKSVWKSLAQERPWQGRKSLLLLKGWHLH